MGLIKPHASSGDPAAPAKNNALVNNSCGESVWYFSENYPNGIEVANGVEIRDSVTVGSLYAVLYNSDAVAPSFQTGGTENRALYMSGSFSFSRPSGVSSSINALRMWAADDDTPIELWCDPA